MKNIFKKLGLFVLASTVFVACDQTEDVNYTPQVYDKVPGDLTVSFTNAVDNSFDVNFASTKDGIAYYRIQPTGGAVPTGADLVNGQVKHSLTPGATASTTYDDAVYGGYEFEVYSVMASPDGYLSNVMRSTITTPDTSDPMFLRDASSPAFQSGGISPFGAVTFAFDEPVFYQGGDITFTGFNSGRVITVSGAAVTGSGTTSITISDHGTFAPDDFIIVRWGADTFKDNVGKSVAELSGFNHYFRTRVFTLEETAMLMGGNYNYSTVFYGGLSGFYQGLFTGNPGAFLPDTGEFEVTHASGTQLNGINLFSGFINFGLDEPQTLPMTITEDAWATGYNALAEVEPVRSVITTGGQTTDWTHYAGFFGPNPGGYNFDSGEIIQYLSLVVTDGPAIDDIDYIYNRIGTYSKSDMNATIQKSKEIKAQDKSKATGNFVLSY